MPILQARIKNSDYDQVLLRWREGPARAMREAQGEMLEARLREAVVSCGVRLDEDTEVQIVGGVYREAGIVHACRSQDGRFILSIWITSDPELELPRFARDPGILAVENFLTEEQAEQILDELDRELGADRDESSATRRALRQLVTGFRLLRLGNALGKMCVRSRATPLELMLK